MLVKFVLIEKIEKFFNQSQFVKIEHLYTISQTVIQSSSSSNLLINNEFAKIDAVDNGWM